jgi:glycosyltransferase involved in cell wall biosynthesis
VKTRVAIDVSGLAWRYRTGVQNLYWAYVDAWVQQTGWHENFDLVFYDRSGSYNHRIAEAVGAAYLASAPRWWPARLRRPLQALVRGIGAFNPDIGGTVNQVWNWNIHNPAGCAGSITVPDVLPLEYPEWFDARFRRLTESSLRFATGHARHVFAISHDVKQRICQTTGLPSERVRVVYPGIDAAYFAPPPTDDVTPLLQKHGLQVGRYLLSSGFLDPRKNLARQLRAFGQVVARGATDLKYALTGMRTALSDEVVKIIESPPMRSNVVFLGYVPQAELITLTRHSAALMYCSLAEGFGLPIIEAMAVGAPVVTSATTSMRELAQGRARMVEPVDIDDIAQAIEETVGQSASERRGMIDANRSFASRFTIENWLGAHLDAFAGQPERSRWS